MKNIYIRLLDEGVKVYRPVPASKIKENSYKIEGEDIYDPENETWEFPRGSRVFVKEQLLEGEAVLVAIAKE